MRYSVDVFIGNPLASPGICGTVDLKYSNPSPELKVSATCIGCIKRIGIYGSDLVTHIAILRDYVGIIEINGDRRGFRKTGNQYPMLGLSLQS